MVEEHDDTLLVRRSEPLQKANVKTLPYPGFPTDMQPQIAAVLSLAQGTSLVTEGVYGDNRFTLCGRAEAHGCPHSGGRQGGRGRGRRPARWARLFRPATCGPVRRWSSPVWPPRAPPSSSCVQYIERGYEDLVGKLRAVGADIAMVDVPEESEVESHIS